MHKLILLASAAAVAILPATPAMAQSADPATAWTGPYIGANVGYIFNGDTRFDNTTGDLSNNQAALDNSLRPTQQTVEDKGITLGAQVGYNAVVGNGFLIGAEADLSYTNLDQTDTLSNTTNLAPGVTPSTDTFTRVNQYNSELKYLGTLRGRVGYAFDNVLVYGTGGLAFGKVKNSATFFGPNLPDTPFFTGRNNDMKTGYALGGGVEFAMPNMAMFGSGATLRAEYLHYDLGRDNLRLDGVGPAATLGGYDTRVGTKGDLVRLGVNFKF